jgi:hypothetical protein
MLFEPNNALIAQQLAARAIVPPRSEWRYETVQLNSAEEYGRLTSSNDYLRRHESAKAIADLFEPLADYGPHLEPPSRGSW